MATMNAVEGTSTTDLVDRARQGDQSAWDGLVDRYTRLVWHVVLGFPKLDESAKADAHQTTWLRLAEELDRIREPERLGSWLATTARRECIRLVERQGREVPIFAIDGEPNTDHLDRHLLDSERDAELWRAFRELDVGSQRLLRLLLADPPFTYDEIAAILDMKRGSIGPTRRRCLDALRAKLSLAQLDDRP